MDQTDKSSTLTRIVLSVILLAAAISSVQAAETGSAKRVLIISTGSRFSAGFAVAHERIIEALGKIPAVRTETYGEDLDIIRFPTERFQRLFGEYLAEKYIDQRPDLIMLLYVGNLGVAGKLLQHLFPGTPVVVVGLTEEEVRPNQFGRPISGVAQRLDPRASRELILRSQPETRRIVVIGGTAEVDRSVIDRTKGAARSFAGRVEFDFWDNRTVPELRQSVSGLPPKTAILFSRMFRDGAGHAYVSSQVGKWISQWANAPVYVMADSILGTGAVGGALVTIDLLGKRAGELARLILTGTPPASLPFEIRTDTVPVSDWRALKRWGINESRLPPGSLVRSRPVSIWEQYGWYIAGALTIIAIQAVLILGLVLRRAHRRRAEAELRETEEFMELSTTAGELGLWVRDLDRSNMWANQRLRSLFGFGEDDVLRFDDLLARIHPDDRTRVVSIVQQAQENDSVFEADFRILSNGTERWIAAKVGSVPEARGHVRRRMGAVTDITARKKAELEAQRDRDELAHAGRVSVMGQLASALAHELNQPLGAILRNAEAAELFLQGIPPDLQEVRGILADIRKDDQRAGEVIDRMRAFLKRREFQWSELNLNALVEEVASLVRPDAERRRVKLVLNLDPTLLPIRGDRVQLQQVLLNFLLNAMDATTSDAPEDRHVVVGTRYVDGQAEVAVTDSGHGVAPEILKHLFEPFFTTKANGMGLGLAISHNIIQAHRGIYARRTIQTEALRSRLLWRP
ncbi:MAG: sensor histidine kinase [Candidatus Binatia bacterium]